MDFATIVEDFGSIFCCFGGGEVIEDDGGSGSGPFGGGRAEASRLLGGIAVGHVGLSEVRTGGEARQTTTERKERGCDE